MDVHKVTNMPHNYWQLGFSMGKQFYMNKLDNRVQ